MTTPAVNPNSLFNVIPGQQNAESRGSDPIAEFSQLLQNALDREQADLEYRDGSIVLSDSILREGSEGEIPNLDLRSGTAGFDRLGVLILRGLNNVSESLVFGQEVQELDLDISHSPNVVDTDISLIGVDDLGFLDADNQRPNIDSISSQLNLDQLTLHNYRRSANALTLSVPPKIRTRSIAISPTILHAAPLSSIANQTRSPNAIIETETAQSAREVNAREVSEAQNTEIEVTVIRGELGLIVQIISPTLDSRLSKALENRLKRLVEQTGEKIESFKFVSTENAYDFPNIERASNGSN